MMKYPIGIQTFEEIVTGKWAYVDKTGFIPKLVNGTKYVFLSRPRRFGKSLFLSTLDAYFSGRKDLFEGLEVAKTETEWLKYPVLRFDFNTGNYGNIKGLAAHLQSSLSYYEKQYDCEPVTEEFAERFKWLIRAAHQKTGRKVVILIDEYEKPLLEAIGTPDLQEEVRNSLKPFYGCLKSCDEHIQFAMLTGVTKYGHLSVFSDLNNLTDISLNPEYAAICGITHDELTENFSASIHEFAEKEEIEDREMMNILVRHYDSYRFSKKDIKVFNPFSLLSALAAKEIRDYWFMSGTPSFLIRLIRENRIRLQNLEEYEVRESSLTGVDADYEDAIPVLYQSGYLTIKKYDREFRSYTLGYPNHEVREGFLNNVMRIYNGSTEAQNFQIERMIVDAARKGEPEVLMRNVSALLAGIPYSRMETRDEFWFRDMMYVIFRLLGFRIEVERHISTGRLDFVINTHEYVYIIEFKYDRSAQEALNQIIDKGYYRPYETGCHKIYLIGSNYAPDTRTLDYIIRGWSGEES